VSKSTSGQGSKLGTGLGSSAHVRRTPPTPSRVFDTYWHFAAERQEVYLRRVSGQEGPWTEDSVLNTYKFTNAYRAADRVSQYLIREVIYRDAFDARDTAFRVLLFKLFNKIETWQLLQRHFPKLSIRSFDVRQFDAVLSKALRAGTRIYSAAYIMPNAPREHEGSFKHRTHLDLLQRVITDGTLDRVLESGSMKDAYELLLAIPSFGTFLAYQFVIDLNYAPHFQFSENDFVQAGPGALNGLKKCFTSLGDYSTADAIAWVTDRQVEEFAARGIAFKNLWGRALHLVDCQNLFCEVDKYARVAHPEFSVLTGRARIKQRFSPTGTYPTPFFPPKWGIEVRALTLGVKGTQWVRGAQPALFA
jgi:hypothetical protein